MRVGLGCVDLSLTFTCVLKTQDELMEMEIKQLSRQLEAKLARTEIMYVRPHVCGNACMLGFE